MKIKQLFLLFLLFGVTDLYLTYHGVKYPDMEGNKFIRQLIIDYGKNGMVILAIMYGTFFTFLYKVKSKYMLLQSFLPYLLLYATIGHLIGSFTWLKIINGGSDTLTMIKWILYFTLTYLGIINNCLPTKKLYK